MMKVVQNMLKEVDLVLFMINVEEGYGKGDEFIIEKFGQMFMFVFLIVNKIDKIYFDQFFFLIDEYCMCYLFKEIVLILVLEGNNVEILFVQIEVYLLEGFQFYLSDQVIDYLEWFIIFELIREKVFYFIREEVLYSIVVVIEFIKGQENGFIYVVVIIVVEWDF